MPRLALLVAIACCASLLLAASASAGTVNNERPLLFSFRGEDATAGRFTGSEPWTGPVAVTVDYATGDVYVADGGKEAVDRFDANGNAKVFTAGPAAGASSLLGPGVPGSSLFKEQNQYFFSGLNDLAVDNSGGHGGAGEGEQGRLYVSGDGGPIDVFKPSGEYVCTVPKASVEGAAGIAVDAEGHLWVGTGGEHKVLEFANSGCPSAKLKEFPDTSASQRPSRLGVDRSGKDVYLAETWNWPPGTSKYVGEVFDSPVTSLATRSIAVNQSATLPSAALAEHIFLLEDPQEEYELGYEDLKSRFGEYAPCALAGCGATLLGSFGVSLIGDGRGIAYDPALDRVYVGDLFAQRVAAFGPVASGTVPDVTIGGAGEVGAHEATVHGAVDPLSVPNSYHIEVKPLVDEVQEVAVVAQKGGGTFTLEFKGQKTAPISWKATGAEMQTALEGLSSIGTGNVTVSGGREFVPGTTEYKESASYTVTFVGALQGTNVEKLSIDGSELSGEKVTTTVNTKVNGLSSWSSALAQPADAYPSIEPTDSSEHAVTVKLMGLKANHSYQARLVSTNTEAGKDLSSYSMPVTFTTLPPQAPPAISGLAALKITTSSAHIEASIDSQEDETKWKVLRSPHPDVTLSECERQSATTMVGEGTIPNETVGSVKVGADATGLSPGESNCVQVTATNSKGASTAYTVFVSGSVAPSEVQTAFAAPRTDTTARINGYVNPQGDATFNYEFEVSEDGTTWRLAEGCRDGKGEPTAECVSTLNAREPIMVAEELEGLKPATTYHYRLAFAKNEAGTTVGTGEGSFTTRTSEEADSPASCPNEAVRRAQRAAYLPDCRGLELVNQPDKGNQNVFTNVQGGGATSILSDNSEAALWMVISGAPGANTATGDTFLARRTGQSAAAPNGWESRTLIPPAAEQVGKGVDHYLLTEFTPEFTSFDFLTTQGVSVFIEKQGSTLVRTGVGQHSETLAEYPNSSQQLTMEVSEDGRHVVARNAETGELEDFGQSGSSVLLSMMPDGTQAVCKHVGFMEGGSSSASDDPSRHGYRWMDASSAARVYFLSPPNGDCAGPVGLYERNVETGRTTLIDPGTAGKRIGFVRATPDGRSAYFVTNDNYRQYNEKDPTKSEVETADTNGHADVYRWDEASDMSTCLTCVVPDASLSEDAHKELEAVAVSDDFSHVYFESEAQLVPGRGRAGAANIYVLHEGRVSFVAALSGLSQGQLANVESVLSADGDVLVFSALADPRLTADAMTSHCVEPLKGAEGIGPCEELYRYDDRDGSVECVSCSHEGITSYSWRSLNHGFALQGVVAEFGLSSDGRTVAFPTSQPLLRADVNMTSDIYEWRDGRVSLLTDGVSGRQFARAAPTIAGIDAHGNNILFSVAQQGLTGFEQDGLANLYDARIDGGFQVPSPPEACDVASDVCQGPVAVPPFTALPGSALLSSANGNVNSMPAPAAKPKRKPKPKRCAKGFARRRVRGKSRCVKQGRRARRGARRHKS